MLRAAKAFARFVFAIGAVALTAQTIYALRWEFHYDRGPLPIRSYVVHAITLAVAVLLGAAFWTTRRPRGRSILAVIACIANALLAAVPFAFVSHLPLDLLLFNLALLVASLLSIYAFLAPAPEQAAIKPARPKPARIAGDCTRPWFDHTYTILFIGVILVNWDLWGHWASARQLHFSGLISQVITITLAEIVTAAIHESGHALAAAYFRMKLLSYTVGPFQWRRYQGRWIFSFHISGLAAVAGGVNAAPTRGDISRSEDAWVVAAGPLANLLSAPLLFWVTWHIAGSHLEPLWFFFASLAGFSIIIAVFNLFPLRATGGSYSDGARLLQLLTHSPVLELYRTERRILSTLVTSTRFSDLDPAALARAADFFPGTAAAVRYHMCASNAHEDAGRIPEAAACVATAEAIYNENAAIDLPAIHHLGFITFHAIYNRDAAATRLWGNRMSAKPEKPAERRLFCFDRALAAAALAYIEGRAAEAETAWQKADAEARTLPPFGIYELDRGRVALLGDLLNGPIPENVAPAPAAAKAVAAASPTAPNAAQPFDRKAALVTAAVTALLLAGTGAIRFGSYASAIAWHHRHGDYAELGSYRAKLPLLWEVRTIGTRRTTHPEVVRAGDTDIDSRPRIYAFTADPNDDPPPMSEQQMLSTQQAAIASMKEQFSSKGWTVSLVVLKAKPFSLYCNRMDFSQSGSDRRTDLSCGSPRGDEFMYSGPPSGELEAESILSSIE